MPAFEPHPLRCRVSCYLNCIAGIVGILRKIILNLSALNSHLASAVVILFNIGGLTAIICSSICRLPFGFNLAFGRLITIITVHRLPARIDIGIVQPVNCRIIIRVTCHLFFVGSLGNVFPFAGSHTKARQKSSDCKPCSNRHFLQK